MRDFHQRIRSAKVGIVLEIQSDCNWVLEISIHSVINTFIAHTMTMEELAFHTINTFYFDMGVFSA